MSQAHHPAPHVRQASGESSDSPHRTVANGSGSVTDSVVSSVPGPSRAIVRLARIADNLGAIRDHVGPGRAIMLPVKANAYGHGLVPVATYVTEHGLVDWLAVASVGEGVTLREAGVTAPILKLSPCPPGECATALAAGITVAIESVGEADEAQRAAAELRTRRGVDKARPARVHLKIDTGMRRVGVDSKRAGELAAHVAAHCPDLRVEGVFTHFAVSDSSAPEDVRFTLGQLERFRAAMAQVSEALGYRPDLVHAANSGGVLAHPDTWGNLVRPGIMAYGYYPDASTPRTVPIAPALEWRAPLVHVKKVRAGETVSYGRTWTAPRDTYIGTVPVGYADGYRRALSNSARVLQHGHEYPVVGRVCMDQFLVDLGADTQARPGDEVILLGSDGEAAYTADRMADQLGTISYEILTLIGERVRREHSTHP